MGGCVGVMERRYRHRRVADVLRGSDYSMTEGDDSFAHFRDALWRDKHIQTWGGNSQKQIRHSVSAGRLDDGSMIFGGASQDEHELRVLLELPTGQKWLGQFVSKKTARMRPELLCWIDIQGWRSLHKGPKSNYFIVESAKVLYAKYGQGAIASYCSGENPFVDALGEFDSVWRAYSEESDPDERKRLGVSLHSQVDLMLPIFDDLLIDLQHTCFRSMVVGLIPDFKKSDEHAAYHEECNEQNKRQYKVSVDDFVFYKELGSGAFGRVLLAKKISTGHLYAMKVQPKVQLLKTFGTDSERLNLEKFLFASCRHPYIVALHYALQTSKHAIFALTFASGGDLRQRLDAIMMNSPPPRRRSMMADPLGLKTKSSEAEPASTGLPVDEVRLYICQIACALSHLHSKNLIYRDLKPENVLLTSEGICQLTDMGLATFVDERHLQRVSRLALRRPSLGLNYSTAASELEVSLQCVGGVEAPTNGIVKEEEETDRRNSATCLPLKMDLPPHVVTTVASSWDRISSESAIGDVFAEKLWAAEPAMARCACACGGGSGEVAAGAATKAPNPAFVSACVSSMAHVKRLIAALQPRDQSSLATVLLEACSIIGAHELTTKELTIIACCFMTALEACFTGFFDDEVRNSWDAVIGLMMAFCSKHAVVDPTAPSPSTSSHKNEEEGQNEVVKTIAGTAGYMAYELLCDLAQQDVSRRTGCNFKADYWSLGVNMFELLTGRLPFKWVFCESSFSRSTVKAHLSFFQQHFTGGDFQLAQQRGAERGIVFPPAMPADARTMVAALLDMDAGKRLDYEGIKAHAFASDIDWRRLEDGAVQPLYVPEVTPSLPGGRSYCDILGESTGADKKNNHWDEEPPLRFAAAFNSWDYVDDDTIKLEVGVMRFMAKQKSSNKF